MLGSVSTSDAIAALNTLFAHQPSVSLKVKLWDGRAVAFGVSPDVTFVIKDPQTFRRCFGSEDPSEFAEAYADGRLDVEGDLEQAVGTALALRQVELGPIEKLALRSRLGTPASRHSTDDDVRDVRAHYDLSDEFFRLFLDDRMVYSCAYFDAPDASLEAAQARKLDLVCRKLRLTPSDQFLDVGCGWGALVIWAASHYGVRAHGITLSEHQAAEAEHRIAAAGLSGRVTVGIAHYTDLPERTFSKVASVGMYEHVGLAKIPAYLEAVRRTLVPGGTYLHHGITIPEGPRDRTGGEFMLRRVFPGTELHTVPHLLTLLQEAGFESLDVHNLRPHYALTLREWLHRFRRRRSRAVELSSERMARIWETYLAGCAESFATGLLSVHQILCAAPGIDGQIEIPLARTI